MTNLPIATGKRKGQAFAKFHQIERVRESITEAKSQVRSAIDAQVRLANERHYLMAADGTVFCLFHNDGWHYDIFGRAHADRGYPSTTSFSCTTSLADALAAMKTHAETYAS